MRRRILGVLLVALTAGCTSAAPGPPRPEPGTTSAASGCAGDVDCASGFCDLGRCRTPAAVYGRACMPAPRLEGGPRHAKLNVCGAYVCSEGRCRSCSSDAQCQTEAGAPQCRELPGRPGARCGASK